MDFTVAECRFFHDVCGHNNINGVFTRTDRDGLTEYGTKWFGSHNNFGTHSTAFCCVQLTVNARQSTTVLVFFNSNAKKKTRNVSPSTSFTSIAYTMNSPIFRPNACAQRLKGKWLNSRPASWKWNVVDEDDVLVRVRRTIHIVNSNRIGQNDDIDCRKIFGNCNHIPHIVSGDIGERNEKKKTREIYFRCTAEQVILWISRNFAISMHCWDAVDVTHCIHNALCMYLPRYIERICFIDATSRDKIKKKKKGKILLNRDFMRRDKCVSNIFIFRVISSWTVW